MYSIRPRNRRTRTSQVPQLTSILEPEHEEQKQRALQNWWRSMPQGKLLSYLASSTFPNCTICLEYILHIPGGCHDTYWWTCVLRRQETQAMELLDTLNGAHLPTDDGSHTYMLVQHQWRPTSSGE